MSWIKNKSDELAVAAGCYFDEVKAKRVCRFFDKFLFLDVDVPFTLLDWQKEIIYALFGWRKPNGDRRFQVAYIEIPKKNGKTTFLAGLCLYFLIADGRRAGVFSAATARKQASYIFDSASKMISWSSDLRKVCKALPSTKTITHAAEMSRYQALSAEGSSNEGEIMTHLLIDELHRWTENKHKDLYNSLRWGNATKKEAFILMITTAGAEKDGICWEEREYSRDVQSGKKTDHTRYSYIRGADPEDDPWDEATWFKANPSLGFTLPLERFRADALTVQGQSVANQIQFFRYRLNRWPVGTYDSWIPLETFDKCKGVLPDLRDKECVIGLDLGSTSDFSAITLLFKDDGKFYVKPYFWLPEEEVDEKRKYLPELGQWVEDEIVEATPGNITDYEYIYLRILDLGKEFVVREVAADPHFFAVLGSKLIDAGFQVVRIGQGFRDLAVPTRVLGEEIIKGSLVHDGNPCLRYMFANCVVEQNSYGESKLSKRRSPNKIDGISALVNAFSRIEVEAVPEYSAWDGTV